MPCSGCHGLEKGRELNKDRRRKQKREGKGKKEKKNVDNRNRRREMRKYGAQGMGNMKARKGKGLRKCNGEDRAWNSNQGERMQKKVKRGKVTRGR